MVRYLTASFPNPKSPTGVAGLAVVMAFDGRTCVLGVKPLMALKTNKTKATPKTI
jgi:hypothetical protein